MFQNKDFLKPFQWLDNYFASNTRQEPNGNKDEHAEVSSFLAIYEYLQFVASHHQTGSIFCSFACEHNFLGFSFTLKWV